MEYPIYEQLLKMEDPSNSQNSSVIPYLPLKNYQIDTLDKTLELGKVGITPLNSLFMGLGKTLVYINLIADHIARKAARIMSLLVPQPQDIKP